jgi:predicted DNA-binding transcriptional regulator YafY
MRASRLLSTLMLLQTRGRMSAPALAAALEVSQRTVLRDMDHLSAAGVPVWADRGREGGFQLREGWSTQLTGLTETEAQALFLAGLPSAATELGLGGAAASAQLKMLAALPAPLRENALRVGSRLHFDPVDWFRAVTPPAHLQAVADAVWRQSVVRMQYESWSGTRERTVKPLGLVLKAGVWYMAALSDSSAEPRTYKLSSIQSISVQASTFKRPTKFDLAAYWQSATQRFETEIYQGQATLRLSARGMKILREFSPAVAQAAARSAQTDAQRKQWTRVLVPIESIEHAVGQFLRLGPEVEVLSPTALRAQMKRTLQMAAALYAS